MADKKANYCSNCGAETAVADKFCSSCGKATKDLGAKEAGKNSNILPKKLEWQIGEAHFCVDKSRASYTAPTKNPLTTHSEEIGTLMATYGLVKERPGITTVGVTTMSQQNRNEKGWVVRWKDVREVKFDPERRAVLLKEKLFTGGLGGGLGTYHIYCTPENFATVSLACQTFQSNQPQKGNHRSKPAATK